MLLSQKCVGAKFDFSSIFLSFSAYILQPEGFFVSVFFSIWSLERKKQVKESLYLRKGTR